MTTMNNIKHWVAGFVVGMFIAFAPSCGTAKSCSLSSCPTGCCDANNVCQPGNTPVACGQLAGACQTCAFGAQCAFGAVDALQACAVPDTRRPP